MKIEHFAVNVSDPRALAQWYVEHLGLRIARARTEPPYETFLADDNGETVIEVFNNPLGTHVNYGDMHPVTFHIAFTVPDMEADRERLIAAGATADGDIVTAPTGDQLAFVRDPWGIAIQLVKRQTPLL
jgi:catechol 2,3-dioxygenase-like lactoylglutathione lyase family enzyme